LKKKQLYEMPSISLVQPYYSPISVSLYPHFSILLLGVGVFFLSWFFVYEVTTGSEALKRRRNPYKELLLALVASVFLGFGTLFLLLWTGVYV